MARHVLVVHPVGGLIVRVDGIFISDLCRAGSLLIHVRSSDQLRTEEPALPPRQLHIHRHVIIRLLQTQRLSWDSHKKTPSERCTRSDESHIVLLQHCHHHSLCDCWTSDFWLNRWSKSQIMNHQNWFLIWVRLSFQF